PAGDIGGPALRTGGGDQADQGSEPQEKPRHGPLDARPAAGQARDDEQRDRRRCTSPRVWYLMNEIMSPRDESLDRALAEAAFVCVLLLVRELLARGASPDAR